MEKIKLNNWFIFVVFISLAIYCSDLINVFFRNEPVEKRLLRYEQELNKEMISVSDGVTILKSVILTDRTLSFNYQIPTISTNNIDEDSVAEFSKEQYLRIRSSTCGGAIKKLLDDGASFNFVYHDSKDLEFTRIHIDKIDCNASGNQ